MAECFIDITQRLAADGESVFYEDLCFRFGKTVSFYCIAGVGETYTEVFF